MVKRRYRSREVAREAARIVAVATSLQVAGCSFSIPSLAPNPDDIETGSIEPAREKRLSPGLGDEDWRRAKGSLAIALDLHGNGRPVKWDNPETHAAGTIAPAGPAAVEADEVCREFTASVTFPDRDPTHLAGKACKLSDEWVIRTVLPRKI